MTLKEELSFKEQVCYHFLILELGSIANLIPVENLTDV